MPTIVCKSKQWLPIINEAWREIADAIPGIGEIADADNLHIHLVDSINFLVATGEGKRSDVYGIYNGTIYGPPTIILRSPQGLAHEIGHWLDDAKNTVEFGLGRPEEWLHTRTSYRKLMGCALGICIENGMQRDGYWDAPKEIFACLFNTGVGYIVTEASGRYPISCETHHLFDYEHYDPESEDIVIFPAHYYESYWDEMHQDWLRATRRAVKSLQKDKDHLRGPIPTQNKRDPSNSSRKLGTDVSL